MLRVDVHRRPKAANLRRKRLAQPRDTTPFLLARVKALTGGESLKTNVALTERNARLASRAAVELRGKGW